jgi:hypothetical protein
LAASRAAAFKAAFGQPKVIAAKSLKSLLVPAVSATAAESARAESTRGGGTVCVVLAAGGAPGTVLQATSATIVTTVMFFIADPASVALKILLFHTQPLCVPSDLRTHRGLD